MPAIYLDFREAFNMVSHTALTVKLVKYRVEKRTTRWVDNRMGYGIQWVLISSAKSTKKVAGYSWCSSGIHTRAKAPHVLINDLDEVRECTSSKFWCDTCWG